MKFEKVGKLVNDGLYRATIRSTPLEGNTNKMKNRYKLECDVAGEDPYDIYDMFADLANAFNETLNGIENGPAITKWMERQDQIKTILQK